LTAELADAHSPNAYAQQTSAVITLFIRKLLLPSDLGKNGLAVSIDRGIAILVDRLEKFPDTVIRDYPRWRFDCRYLPKIAQVVTVLQQS
jgi:hypothetical protein